MKKIVFALAMSALLSGCSRSPAIFPLNPFPTMTALSCELKAVHQGALNPDYQRENAGSVMKLTITNLNEKAGSAQVIGNVGTAEVLFTRLGEQLQFFEQTPAGNLTLLTVYTPPEAGKPLPAAYSRHILSTPANVSISQYAGSCQPKV